MIRTRFPAALLSSEHAFSPKKVSFRLASEKNSNRYLYKKEIFEFLHSVNNNIISRLGSFNFPKSLPLSFYSTLRVLLFK